MEASQKIAVRIKTAADMLEYDNSTIRRYIRRGDLEATGSGRGRRVTMRSIEALVNGERGIWRKDKAKRSSAITPSPRVARARSEENNPRTVETLMSEPPNRLEPTEGSIRSRFAGV